MKRLARGVYQIPIAGIVLAALARTAAGVGAQVAQTAVSAARADDPTLNGFAVEDAVAPGGDVHFKIATDATAFSIAIYRFMNGEGDDVLVASLPAPAAPQVQPPCLQDAATSALDCSNWSPSAAWTVPAEAAPGSYYALLRRGDTGRVNHILFVVGATR